MLWRDRLIGVVLGLLLGLGVIVVFVFVYSEQTVDAPSISNGTRGAARDGRPIPRVPGVQGRPTPEATVRVVGGAPPPSGPVQLHYRKGDQIRLRVVTDAAVDLQVLGLGVGMSANPGKGDVTSFKASKTGDFPLIVATSHIDVARIAITGN